MLKAYHFLKTDMRSGFGPEAPWEVGEKRTLDKAIKVKLCEFGYHSSPTLWDALQYALGPVACLVEISRPVQKDETKSISRSRKLIKAVNIERGLRLYATDCAARVLRRLDRKRLNKRELEAVRVARDLANGRIIADAWEAARGAGSAAAAAVVTEIEWQREHFEQMFGGIFQCGPNRCGPDASPQRQTPRYQLCP